MVFLADDEIGRDLAVVDWASTPVGPLDGWPQSLRTAVSILLSSRFSMWMAWGRDLTFFCNAAYRRDTLGEKYPWALGRPASEVWEEIWADIGPRIDHVMSTGEATWDEGLLLFLERSGYSEETYHTFSYSPLRGEDGHVVGMLCVVKEDTDRVIGERRMATLRDLGSDPSVVRTERQMLNFAADQLAGNPYDLPFTLTYLYDDGDAQLAGVSGIARGHPAVPESLPGDGPSVWPVDKPSRGEAELVELDDSFVDLPPGAWSEPPAQALVVPLLQQGGAPVGMLVVALNRHRKLDEVYRGFIELVAGHIAAGVGSARSYETQQQRAEELAELDRAKTSFFSNISHEFRTPLTLILGPVDELRARAGFDEQTRDELELIHRNGLRLEKLVNTLLDFSRIQAGRMQARFEPVDLPAFTAELASVFRSAVDRAGLTFTVDCPPLNEPVYLDRDMWEKVVLNLLSNALKFTFEGSITVRVRPDDTGATVTVADTGIGVSTAEMPRLFERFHRVENVRARSTEGSGIGLALVRELIGLHGGTITADSREGAGTTFTVRVPFGSGHLAADDLSPRGAGASAGVIAEPYVQEALRWLPTAPGSPTSDAPTLVITPAGSGDGRVRVLIADDNADMREYLTNLLRTSGYQVSAVVDGLQALDAIRGQAPDLVITDVMMPGLDGLQLLAALRKDPRTAALPVLLLSARAGQEASIEGLRAGADDYLVKPFAAADLLARVRANVELARLRNHHARWRTALVDSLQEGFLVCDEHGTVIEVNTAFEEMLGYGPEGLPYPAVHPWWPDAETDPEAHRLVEAAFAGPLDQSHGAFTIPVTHRDGHRVWVAVNFNYAKDPETARRVMVGTFRDVTAEHYAVQRQSALAALNQQLAQAESLDDALRGAVEEFRHVWQARRVTAVMFSGAVTAESVAPEVMCVGDEAGWAELSARQRELIESVRDADLLTTVTGDAGTAGIALQHPRGVLVIWVELSEQRPFTAKDHTLLTVLAGRLGQGLQRVYQLDEQRETAVALQHAMLGPVNMPAGFAVRYHPASRPLEVGGDWYDVVDLDDGRFAIIVGDCVGHGLGAATVMGQLRSACRALFLEQSAPSAVLAGMDRFAARLVGARCTTAFCAVLTLDTGELVYSSAGHPPPIMVQADGTITMLEGGRGLPLALRQGRLRPEVRMTMPARSTLLLYTDGLIERRGTSMDDGIARAADLVRDSRSCALDDVADDLMSGLEPGGGYPDDVAVLLYRQPAPLAKDFAADASQLAPSRDALRSWLSQAGVEAGQIQDVLIATGEAVANAIEHGHRDRPEGIVSLRATAVGDRLQVTVTDTGRWKMPPAVADVSRGRGMILMRGLMEDLAIHTDDVGTTVRLHTRIV